MTTYGIDLDDRALAEAQRLMDRTDVEEVVGIALSQWVSAARARRKPITKEDLPRFGELVRDLGDPEVMR